MEAFGEPSGRIGHTMCRRWLVLLLACLSLHAVGAEPCSGHCVVKAERVTPAGNVQFDNSQPLMTAVGCLETIEITYGSNVVMGSLAAPPKLVLMLGADRATSITASAVLDDSNAGLKNKICCREHPMDRDGLLAEAGLQNEKCQSEQTLALIPFNLFACMIQNPIQRNLTTGTAMIRIQFIVPERADITVGNNIDMMGTTDGSNTFVLQAEYEQFSNGKTTIIRAPEYSIDVQVQRCSACLEKAEGLNMLAKRLGTHWTQVYSANHDIVGSPDELEQARLLRLGSLYSVRKRDTLMSIALKFGVTVNQLFKWNGYLRNELDTMPESPNHMSRALTLGQVSCPCLLSSPLSPALFVSSARGARRRRAWRAPFVTIALVGSIFMFCLMCLSGGPQDPKLEPRGSSALFWGAASLSSPLRRMGLGVCAVDWLYAMLPLNADMPCCILKSIV